MQKQLVKKEAEKYLPDFVQFVKLTLKFMEVERMIRVTANGKRRWENDLEHAGQLALVAWYTAERMGLSLSTEKLLMYALAHDLVEVYAGDTPVYDKSKRKHASKAAREAKAAARIQKEFPEFTALHAAIHRYEQMADEESKFVYSLDKVLPAVNVYLDGGKLLRELKVTLPEFKEKKHGKADRSPLVAPLYEEVEKLFVKNEKKLFGKKSTVRV